MSLFYTGEIRLLANTYAPRLWSQCLGQNLSISQSTALFSLIGTTYGGDGRTSFALPNLIGRVPMSYGTGPGLPPCFLGEESGAAVYPLRDTQMPNHNHAAYTRATNDPAQFTDEPTDSFVSRQGSATVAKPFYKDPPGAGQITMSNYALAQTGGNQAHENRQPFMCINYYIAFDGVYPHRK